MELNNLSCIRNAGCLLAGMLFSGVGVGSLAAQQIDAYYADAIWPGDGPVIKDAVLLVQDSKVLAMGPRKEIEVPASAIRHDMAGQNLIPGLVIAQTNLVESARDSDYAVTPQVRAADGFDPFDDYDELLARGVTTVQLSPGSGRLMPGQGAVVKLAGRQPEQQVLAESESLKIVLTRDALSPPTIYEPPVGAVSVERPLAPTQPQLATSLAQAIVGLDALFVQAEDPNATDEVLATLAQLRKARRTMRFSVENAAEVQAALELAEKHQLRWMAVDPVDVGPLQSVDWKNRQAVGVLLNPEFRPGRITNPGILVPGNPPPDQVWERAKKLVDAGAGNKLALVAATDADLKDLLFTARIFARGGLSNQQILRMLTANPARMLGVGNRVGKLRTGSDADFVVLSGQPFAAGSRVAATYLNGELAYELKTKSPASMISAAKVYTPHGFISGGVAVNAGKITGVGTQLSMARGATVKHFPDAYIVPGMLDCQTVLGIGGTLSERIGLDTKLGELLARDDDQIARARQGGVTTGLFSSTQLPSPVLAFKLTDQPRPVMDPVALRFKIEGNLTAAEESLRSTLRGGKAYSDAWDKYDKEYAEYQLKLKEYEAAKAKYDAAMKAAAAKKEAEQKAAEKQAAEGKADDKDDPSKKPSEQPQDSKPAKEDAGKSDRPADAGKPATEDKSTDAAKGGSSDGGKDSKDGQPSEELKEPTKPTEPKKPAENSGLKPYRELFQKKIVALVDLDNPRAVEVAIKLFRQEFDIRTAIVADGNAAEQAELLAKHDVLVILGPQLFGEIDGQPVNFPAEIRVAGGKLAFQSKASTGVSHLPDAVAFSVFEGLGRSDALQGMSHGPAEFLGLKSLGTIEVGRDADLVVLSGPPFDIGTQVLAVMIDGNWVFEKESK